MVTPSLYKYSPLKKELCEIKPRQNIMNIVANKTGRIDCKSCTTQTYYLVDSFKGNSFIKGFICVCVLIDCGKLCIFF